MLRRPAQATSSLRTPKAAVHLTGPLRQSSTTHTSFVWANRVSSLTLLTPHTRTFTSTHVSLAKAKSRFITERDKFPKYQPKLTDQEQLEADMATEFSNAAGGTLKQKLAGAKLQRKYFEEQLHRQDRKLAVEEVVSKLPPLTEGEVDDFYINLFASGNELGNLPDFESPTHKPEALEDVKPYADQRVDTDRLLEEQRVEKEFWLDVQREQAARRRALANLETPASEGPHALGSGEVTTAQLEAPKTSESVQEADQEVEFEMVGVKQTKSRLGARLLARELETDRTIQHGQSSLNNSASSHTSLQQSSQQTKSKPHAPLPSVSSAKPKEPELTLSFEERYPNAFKASDPSYEVPGSDQHATIDRSTLARPSLSPTFNHLPPSQTLPPGLHPNSPAIANFSELVGVSTPATMAELDPSLLPSQPIPSQTLSPKARHAQNALTIPRPSPTSSLVTIPTSAEISPLYASTFRPARSPVILGVEAAIHAAESTQASLSTSEGPTPSLIPLDRSLPRGGIHQPTKRDPGPPSLQGSIMTPRSKAIPLGLLTKSEWQEEVFSALRRVQAPRQNAAQRERAAAREAAYKGRGRIPVLTRADKLLKFKQAGAGMEAAYVLDLMQRSGHTPPKQWYQDVIAHLSSTGDSKGVAEVIQQYERAGYPVHKKLHGHLVLAHVARSDLHSAVATMHDLEDKDLYPELPVYQALLAPLVNSPISHHRATGWDLFAHMRLVAHPIPSKEVYVEMIKACGHKDYPEPERGLDLFKEMTEDNAIQPDVHAYNAVIYAACNNSVKEHSFYLEGFRLMKQMLDFYQLAAPESAQRALYTPNRETFHALLEGARRAGDIARTRWVLTEMIRFANYRGLEDDGRAVAPTARTMMLVFQAYATATVKITRDMLRLQAVEAQRKQLQIEAAQQQIEAASMPESDQGVEDSSSATSASSPSPSASLSPDSVSSPATTTSLSSSSSSSSSSAISSSRDQVTIESSSNPTPNSTEESVEIEAGVVDADGQTTKLRADQLEDTWVQGTDTNEIRTTHPDPTGPDPDASTPTNVQTSPIPQSAQEIVIEVERLLHHVRTDSKVYRTSPGERSPTGSLPPLRFVEITTPLVDTYLTVHYSHNTLEASIDKFDSTFRELGVNRSGHSYRAFFSRLRYTHSSERVLAATRGFEVFKEWEAFEKEGERKIHLAELEHGHLRARELREILGLDERVIEKIWVTMIAIMTCADQLDLAKSIVARFMVLYPPSKIQSAHLPPLPSRALVRMVPRHEIRPDPLPPHLLWPDLAPLHQRYVTYQQKQGIAYVKWVVQSYESALRAYREMKLNAGKPGRTRQEEAAYNTRLVSVQRGKEAKGAEPYLKRKARDLKDFEGVMGKPPVDMQKWGRKEWKILRQHGMEAVQRYQRALRQW